MHEADEDRGGMPLHILREDFASVRPDAAAKLFSERTPKITWHRVKEYQLMSLRMAAELVVHEMPSYSKLKQPPKLFLRGDILTKPFKFKVLPSVYVSANNPGAMEMSDELHAKYSSAGLSLSRQMPPEFAAYDINNVQSEEDEASRAHPTVACTTYTHMLLYLCKETFVGDAGRRLAHEIREANQLSLRIVMVHECDPDKNGGPFAQVVRTTCANHAGALKEPCSKFSTVARKAQRQDKEISRHHPVRDASLVRRIQCCHHQHGNLP